MDQAILSACLPGYVELTLVLHHPNLVLEETASQAASYATRQSRNGCRLRSAVPPVLVNRTRRCGFQVVPLHGPNETTPRIPAQPFPGRESGPSSVSGRKRPELREGREVSRSAAPHSISEPAPVLSVFPMSSYLLLFGQEANCHTFEAGSAWLRWPHCYGLRRQETRPSRLRQVPISNLIGSQDHTPGMKASFGRKHKPTTARAERGRKPPSGERKKEPQ